ncbi:MAG TPA: diacylglycerol kinase family protein [Myxococcota bacterium]|nr:diacylglycerol kinase family protein [Myxococcota bacterium]
MNNLRAGRSNPQVRRILQLLGDYPRVAHVETTSVRAVPEALATLARQDVELLVVNGGDGTLQYTITQILTTDDFSQIPMVAPLRGGRTNMTALDIGSHRDPVKGLQGLLEDAKAGRIADRLVDRPVLRVETLRDRELHYGFFFGAGMIHRAIGLTHRLFPHGRMQGSFGAGSVTAALVLRAVARRQDGVLTPDKAQILLDGRLVDAGEFTLIIASSLQRLFLRINPFWGTQAAPVRFTAIATGSERTAVAALGILCGRPAPFVRPEAGYTSRNVHTAELRLDAGFTVDGEIVPPRSGEIVRIAGDRRIRFVRA